MTIMVGHRIVGAAPAHGSAGCDVHQVPSVRRYKRALRVEQAEHAGTVILFDKREYFTLPEGVATEVWALLAQARSLDELVAWLQDQYDAPRGVIEADVAELLEQLRRARLIDAVGPDGRRLPEPRAWWRTLWRAR